jgi:hypothetical protein
MSDERPSNDAPDGEPRPEAPAKQPIDVELLASMPRVARDPRAPGGGIGRWATFGCVAVLLMLLVLLLIGVNVTRRTVWMSYARVQQRLVEELPPQLPSGERLRIERNLQRYRARVEMDPDPLPAIGALLAEAGQALQDDRLTAAEVEQLNRFLERALEADLEAGR